MKKKNKKIKKLDEGHTQILLEDIRSNMKFIAEGHSALNKKFDDMKEVLDIHTEEIAIIKSVVISHSRDIKEIKSDIGILKCDVSELKSDVKRIDQKLDTQIENNDKRFQKIEEKVFI